MARQEILDWMEKYGVSVTSEFIPFSKSRNAGKKEKSLNWVGVLRRKDREILRTEYSAGVGHCPASKASIKRLGSPNCLMRAEAIDIEIETGRKAAVWGERPYAGQEKIEPDAVSFVASIFMNTDVLNFSDFESWADEFGYDPDSRSAEKTYQECLKISLKLRNGIGHEALEELRTACEDY